jgi:hypothetical protein
LSYPYELFLYKNKIIVKISMKYLNIIASYLPNIACFPSNHCVGAKVIKNCDPLVSGPEFAIDKIPAPTENLNLCFERNIYLNINII